MAEGKLGRPELTQEELDVFAAKMAPFLRQGFSLRKSAIFGHVNKDSVYKYYASNPIFADKIDELMGYKAKTYNDIILWRLNYIKKNIQELQEIEADPDEDPKNKKTKIMAYMPRRDDWDFLEWAGVTDKALRDEFGARTEITGKDGKDLVPTDTLDADKAKELATRIAEQIVIMGGNATSTDSGGEASDNGELVADTGFTTDDASAVSTGDVDAG